MMDLRDIWRYWTAGGPLLMPLALVCFALWFSFLRGRRSVRRLLRDQDRWKPALDRAEVTGSLQALHMDMRANAGPWAALMAPALRRITRGASPSRVFERVNMALDEEHRRRIVWLAALTAAAPLLGLLGTVTGMIATFTAVSSAGGNTLEQVSDGIRTALITTQFGLIIAIPGLFGLSQLKRFRRRADDRLQQWRIMVMAVLRGNMA